MYPKFFGFIPAYVLLAAIGFAAAFGLAMLRRKKYEYKVLDVVAMFFASVLGILIGARLLFVITEIPAIIDHNFSWEIIERRVLNAGFVFYGGLIGALLCIYILSKYMKLDSKKMLSFVSPCYTAFHAFGRIGCLLGGCCYGVESDFGMITIAGESITRVPVQLYEAIALVLITVVLLLVEVGELKKEKIPNLLPLYIALYAPARFVLEFWRGDILRGVFNFKFVYATVDGRFNGSFSLSTSQIISLILLIALFIYLGYKYALRRHDRKAEKERLASETITELEAVDTEVVEEAKPLGPEDEVVPQNTEEN